MTDNEYMHYVIKQLEKRKLNELDKKFLEYCKFYLTKKDNLPFGLKQHLYDIHIKHLDYELSY